MAATKMAANQHMHSFTTLIKRLEAATSRLEDMAEAVGGTPGDSGIDAAAQHAAVAAGAPELTNVSKPSPPAEPEPEPLPRSIEAFDTLIENDVKPFVEISQKFEGPVAEQSKAVLQAFEAERKYLLVSTKAKKPDPQPPELFTDLHRASDEINSIRESNRPSPFFTHLSAVAEGVFALAWFMEGRPADFVKDTLGGAQFYGNRVLSEYKEKDKSHVEYIQAYYQIFKSLIDYIKEYYPRGVTWNNQDGIDVMDALKEVASKPKAPQPPQAPKGGATGPPPPPLPDMAKLGAPPPPPPPPPPGAAPAPASKSPDDMSAVFEQLNQGSAVTANLRKVDNSQKTHKNPSLRASSLVPEQGATTRGKSPAPSKKPKPESMRAKKPPRKQLDGNKWFIEHYDSPSDVIEIDARLSHSILISRCNKAIIKVQNKANAISIDNCNDLSIIVDSLVSSVDVIKSPKFALQIDGVVPTVLLDQVDGATIYLNKDSLGTEVLSSKCSSINITLPPNEAKGEEDYKECPLPEQFRTYIKDGAVVSEIVEHAG